MTARLRSAKVPTRRLLIRPSTAEAWVREAREDGFADGFVAGVAAAQRKPPQRPEGHPQPRAALRAVPDTDEE